MNIEKFNAYLEKKITLGEKQFENSRVAKSYWSGFVSALKDAQREFKAMADYEKSVVENEEFDYGHDVVHSSKELQEIEL